MELKANIKTQGSEATVWIPKLYEASIGLKLK